MEDQPTSAGHELLCCRNWFYCLLLLMSSNSTVDCIVMKVLEFILVLSSAVIELIGLVRKQIDLVCINVSLGLFHISLPPQHRCFHSRNFHSLETDTDKTTSISLLDTLFLFGSFQVLGVFEVNTLVEKLFVQLLTITILLLQPNHTCF